MRAKGVYENLGLMEFTRGDSPFRSMGIGKEGALKTEMGKEYTEDRRDQLLWTITHNNIPLTIYLFEGPGVEPGKLYWDEINKLKEFNRGYFSMMEEPMSEDLKEILYYYERKTNMIQSRVEYFLEKYKDKGLK
jgi:hypothetical protein